MQDVLNSQSLNPLKGKLATLTTRATMPGPEGKTLKLDHVGVFEGIARPNAECTEMYMVGESDTATADRFAVLRNTETGKKQEIPLGMLTSARYGKKES